MMKPLILTRTLFRAPSRLCSFPRSLHSSSRRLQTGTSVPLEGREHILFTGERGALWRRDGGMEIIDGPKRLFLTDEKLQLLIRYSASPVNYIRVQYKDGRREHLPGPINTWHNPVEHLEIKVLPSIQVNSNEVIIVYKQGQNKGKVERRIVTGPTLYVPDPLEWLHKFSWHGSRGGDLFTKEPGALQFEKLRVLPDQMYVNVPEVRTKDDALVVVQLMIFFRIVNVEKMLDASHDPVADFINSVSADVVDFCSSRTFEGFKKTTAPLNSLETYKTLVTRAKAIGFEIDNVVFRGFDASEKLQKMHDHAIEQRTELQLKAETEAKEQELHDLIQEREQARAKKTHQLEKEELLHEEGLKQLRDQTLTNRTKLLKQLETEIKKGQNDENLRYFQELKSLQVNVSDYLLAQLKQPDKVIRIESAGDARPPQVHLELGAEELRKSSKVEAQK